ncbi:flagellar hook assembly protein FlgD [Desulfosoma caldarium]|uniref:Basal-body rod modification protein FlgD n=1 Tax=Desulfosoma caldarium TaxID=610254 RepID=A0A3N1VPQ6_9BACT|nr:FlgD immunoglobulin-like domain containing protein [Desulfosoma caldarium]ROR01877.1 flagellar basal-body rod modification protein FlgD [Desulfosoma caldarium]
MAVASVPALTQKALAASAANSVGGQNLSDMNAFLMLFTTQLQHQDPTNPMAAYEMAAQLAQFSTVEKLTQVHTLLREQKDYLISINNSLGVQLLGKNVVAQDDQLYVKDGTVSRAGFDLEAPARVQVTITDSAGKSVRTLSLGSVEAGRQEFTWDGKDDQGKAVPNGIYTFSVEATNTSGESMAAQPLVRGEVFGLVMEQGVNYVVLEHSGGLRVPVSFITTIETAPNSGETTPEAAT